MQFYNKKKSACEHPALSALLKGSWLMSQQCHNSPWWSLEGLDHRLQPSHPKNEPFDQMKIQLLVISAKPQEGPSLSRPTRHIAHAGNCHSRHYMTAQSKLAWWDASCYPPSVAHFPTSPSSPEWVVGTRFWDAVCVPCYRSICQHGSLYTLLALGEEPALPNFTTVISQNKYNKHSNVFVIVICNKSKEIGRE